MNIFLSYEITARELDGNILTGLVAASRGHRAIVCPWPMMMRGILIRRRQPGFVHMKSITPNKASLVFQNIIKFFGYQISSLDQEAGIHSISYEHLANLRFGEASMLGADLVFCWGPDDYELLQQIYPEHSEKIIMSGSPRVDLWRPKFSNVYHDSEQVVKPFVLVLSSISGPMNINGLHGNLRALRKGGYVDRLPELEEKLVGQYKEGAELMLAYLDLIRFISLNNTEIGIVVKPHPAEDAKIWQEVLGEVDRVWVDTKSPTSQLIRQCLVSITSGSTTAFEAVLSETPLISFQPIELHHRESGFADSLGMRAGNVKEVQAIVSAIAELEKNQTGKDFPNAASTVVSQKVYFEDGQLAAERMVESWEMVFRNRVGRRVGGSIFSMPLEELKYFVASAFPFLIPLVARRRRPVFASGRQENWKRPPLARKVVKARLEKMRSILGLQDLVRYRFKGRRGLVIEPRRATPVGSRLLSKLGSRLGQRVSHGPRQRKA